MIWKLVLAAVTVLVQQDMVSAQFTMIPSTTTAAELWNPYTWFWPYAIASAESYRDYFQKAQKATNELYLQIYATNANPLITGNWSGAKTPQIGAGSSNSTQTNQNQTANNNNNQGEKPSQPSSGGNGGENSTGDQPKDENQTSANSTTGA